ncbi:phospholipase D1 [Pelomyxa schiedti]|nr:phospholipase D1 [Pelomyxa schiedti]
MGNSIEPVTPQEAATKGGREEKKPEGSEGSHVRSRSGSGSSSGSSSSDEGVSATLTTAAGTYDEVSSVAETASIASHATTAAAKETPSKSSLGAEHTEEIPLEGEVAESRIGEALDVAGAGVHVGDLLTLMVVLPPATTGAQCEGEQTAAEQSEHNPMLQKTVDVEATADKKEKPRDGTESASTSGSDSDSESSEDDEPSESPAPTGRTSAAADPAARKKDSGPKRKIKEVAAEAREGVKAVAAEARAAVRGGKQKAESPVPKSVELKSSTHRRWKRHSHRSIMMTIWNTTSTNLVWVKPHINTLEFGEWEPAPPREIPPGHAEMFAARSAYLKKLADSEESFSSVIQAMLTHGGTKGYVMFDSDLSVHDKQPLLFISWDIPSGGKRLFRVTTSKPKAYSVVVHNLRGHKKKHARVVIQLLESKVRLSKNVRDTLCRSSYFSTHEVQELFSAYEAVVFPDKEMTKTHFLKLFPEIGSDPLIDSIFKSIGKGDTISFQDYVICLSLATRGTPLERASLAFAMCPQRSEGTLHIDELTNALALQHKFPSTYSPETIIHKLFGSLKPKSSEAAPSTEKESTTQELTASLPESGMAATVSSPPSSTTTPLRLTVTKEEFLQVAVNDSDFQSGFGLFDYLREKVIVPLEQAMNVPEQIEGPALIGSKKCHAAVRGPFFCYDDPTEKDAPHVISLYQSSVKMDMAGINISTSQWKEIINFEDKSQITPWLATLSSLSHKQNRFGSFAPERERINMACFSNGMEYMEEVHGVMHRAKNRIFIAGWVVSPGLWLVRDWQSGGIPPTDWPGDIRKLECLLLKKAYLGVKIYVMVWSSLRVPGVDLQSSEVVSHLNSMHPNILACSHTLSDPTSFWSHHQKFIVIDDQIAYLGGIDLTYGRFDTNKYPAVDPNAEVHVGRDYTNPCLVGEINGPSLIELEGMSRTQNPRMPWHDLHVRVDGDAARDAATNFIQRWNFCNPKVIITPEPYNIPISQLLVPENKPAYPNCYCQILRSIGEWSSGFSGTEKSIYKAYMRLVRTAEHFIYIENQYFISSVDAASPLNRLAKVLYHRLRQAIQRNETFSCVVLLPIHPSGDIVDGTCQFIAAQQYKTISRGGHSILEKLQQEFDSTTVSRYIKFFCMRSHGLLNTKVAVSEQIYIHAKGLLVDDRVAIIGSANINDRSLLGDRDSEICAIFEQKGVNMISSTMGGKEYFVSPIVHHLRIRLWQEMTGLPTTQLQDPILATPLLASIAASNSSIFASLYSYLPENCLCTSVIDEIQPPPNFNSCYPLPRSWTTCEKYVAASGAIKGFIVQFPFNMLRDEPSDLSAEKLVVFAAPSVFI